jgi:hypothetical protein
MVTQVTTVKPIGTITVHVRLANAHYTRFEPGLATENLQDPVNDAAAFNGTSITFSASGSGMTPTFPSGVAQLHLVLSNGHYYRFEASGVAVQVQNGDTSSNFGTIDFSTT